MSGTKVLLTGNKGRIIADFDKGILEAEYLDARGFRATLSVPLSEVEFNADNTSFSISYAPSGTTRVSSEGMKHRVCGGEIEEIVEYVRDGKTKNSVWICRKCNQRFDFNRFVSGKNQFPENT